MQCLFTTIQGLRIIRDQNPATSASTVAFMLTLETPGILSNLPPPLSTFPHLFTLPTVFITAASRLSLPAINYQGTRSGLLLSRVCRAAERTTPTTVIHTIKQSSNLPTISKPVFPINSTRYSTAKCARDSFSLLTNRPAASYWQHIT